MDLALDSTGDLAYSGGLLSTVTGEDELKQRLKIAMETGKGEYLYDTDAGVAYQGVVRGKNADLAAAELRRAAMRVEGVTDVVEVDLNWDKLTRELTATVTVSTVYGVIAATATV